MNKVRHIDPVLDDGDISRTGNLLEHCCRGQRYRYPSLGPAQPESDHPLPKSGLPLKILDDVTCMKMPKHSLPENSRKHDE